MNEEKQETLKNAVPIQVWIVAKRMTLPEVVAIYNAAHTGFDPRGVMGYEKAHSLFTANDGTRMHADTLAAFDEVVGERLRESSPQKE